MRKRDAALLLVLLLLWVSMSLGAMYLLHSTTNPDNAVDLTRLFTIG